MLREDKATQLAAYLIGKAGGRLNNLVLQKMMYYTEREMILKWGTPVTYDQFYSLPYGPVLSTTPVCQYDMRHLTTLNNISPGRRNDSLLHDFS
jgi:uncharacterized phage-associated protein